MGDLDPEALRRALEPAEAEAAQRNINLVTRVRRIIVGPGEDVDKAVAAAKAGRRWTRLLRRKADGANYVIARVIVAGNRDEYPEIPSGPDPVAVAARIAREKESEPEESEPEP